MKTLLIIAGLLFSPALVAAPSITLCSHDCSQPLQHPLSEDSWQGITGLFQQPSADDHQQRLQLAKALALMERDIIRQLASEQAPGGQSTDGTARQQLAEQLGELFSNRDETRNTGRFIGLLQDHGLFSQHVLRHSEERSNLLGMTQSTAVIQSVQTGKLYAVDATSSGFGEVPLIMPLQDWKNGTVVKKLPGRINRFMSSDEDKADTGNNSESIHGWD